MIPLLGEKAHPLPGVGSALFFFWPCGGSHKATALALDKTQRDVLHDVKKNQRGLLKLIF